MTVLKSIDPFGWNFSGALTSLHFRDAAMPCVTQPMAGKVGPKMSLREVTTLDVKDALRCWLAGDAQKAIARGVAVLG